VVVLAVVPRDERVEQRHGGELEVPVYTLKRCRSIATIKKIQLNTKYDRVSRSQLLI
jgi:hypothetical protein